MASVKGELKQIPKKEKEEKKEEINKQTKHKEEEDEAQQQQQQQQQQKESILSPTDNLGIKTECIQSLFSLFMFVN